MTAYHKIIDGIASGDAIGEPTALAGIAAESLGSLRCLGEYSVYSADADPQLL
jgi:hypothetical protein